MHENKIHAPVTTWPQLVDVKIEAIRIMQT